MDRLTVDKIKEASVVAKAVQGMFIITQCEYKPFKNKPGVYLQCSLSDKTGSVKAVVWEKAEAIKSWLKNNMAVSISGESTRYNDQPQVAIAKITEVTGDFDSADFVPSLSDERLGGLLAYLKGVYESITDSTCKLLWEKLVFDAVDGRHFRTCPGSSGDVHHGYIGGLMEHTAHMIEMAQTMLVQQPELDRNILLTGCLVHDIGKTKAYNWSVAIEMGDVGRLMHHSVLGYDILSRMEWYRKSIHLPLDRIVMLKLKHICISHHDKEEGSVRRPMFPEAVAVAMLDNANAAVNGVYRFLDKEENLNPEGNWTRFNKMAERSYFMPQEDKGLEVPANEDVERETDGVF